MPFEQRENFYSFLFALGWQVTTIPKDVIANIYSEKSSEISSTNDNTHST